MSSDKEVTIYDIARQLNISAATVSRGLNNSPLIKNVTRDKIIETAEKMGYRSNTIASSLRSKRSYAIGVIVPRLDSYFMSSVLAGMESAAANKGYNLIITQSLEHEAKEKENAHTMYAKRVDGLLVSLAYNTADFSHFLPFIHKKIPLVFFDRVCPQYETTRLIIDNYKAAYAVTKHLIDQGCRRIAHLGGNLLRNVYADRFNGYRQALQDHLLAFEEELLYISDLGEKDALKAAAYILQLKQRPDAVFTANDVMAVYCMMALKESGIKIPKDIAFAGFNNDPISRIIKPGLTTVNYPGFTLGEAGVNNLINQLDSKTGIRPPKTYVLHSDLIIRESSLKKGSVY